MSDLSKDEIREMTKVIMYGEASVAITALLLGETFEGIDVQGRIKNGGSLLIPASAPMEPGNQSLCLAALCAGQMLRCQLAINQMVLRSYTQSFFNERVLPMIGFTFHRQFDEFKKLNFPKLARSCDKRQILSLIWNQVANFLRFKSSDKKQLLFKRLTNEIQVAMAPLSDLIDDVAQILLESKDSNGCEGVASWELITNLIHGQTHLFDLQEKIDSYRTELQRIHPTNSTQTSP